MGCLGTTASVGLSHVTAVTRRGVVFVQSEGVEGLAVGGGGLGAVVKDPDNLAANVSGQDSLRRCITGLPRPLTAR